MRCPKQISNESTKGESETDAAKNGFAGRILKIKKAVNLHRVDMQGCTAQLGRL